MTFEGFLSNTSEGFLSNTTGSEPQCSNGRKQIFGGIIIALVVIGLVGNVLVFSTILILREYKKSVTNWYILQLALADTLFLLMLPFTAQSEIVGTWDFSASLCKFKEAVIFINYYASIYFLVIMSFDRYLAVTKAFASKKWVTSLRSPTASYIISIVGWLLSVLLCTQLFWYSSISDESCKTCGYNFPPESEPPGELFGEYVEYDYLQFFLKLQEANVSDEIELPCRHATSQSLAIWLYGNFFGAFCLPFGLICFFYGMIIQTIVSARGVGNVERQRSYRRRVTMIVLALVALFSISWFPWYIEKLAKLNGLSLTHNACQDLTYAVRGLSYLNSALNPYFYSFLGTHFRDRLKRATNRVGLTSLKSRAHQSIGGSVQKKRKYSTSNSGGSNRCSNKQCSANLKQNEERNHDDFCEEKTMAQKTERTVV